MASSTDGEGDDEMSSSGTGFFISFDNKTPKRQKPKLKSREKKVRNVGLTRWCFFSWVSFTLAVKWTGLEMSFLHQYV